MARHVHHNDEAYPHQEYKKKAFFIVVFLGVFLYGVFYFYRHYSHLWSQKSLHDVVRSAVHILEKIDHDCGIVSFVGEQNTIDFLNIKEFAGNTVGSMHVATPSRWKGPYSLQVLLYRGTPLSIFVHKSGCYVVPGTGTILPDGKVVGKEVIFDNTFDMKTIFEKYPSLIDNGKRLIARIHCNVSRAP